MAEAPPPGTRRPALATYSARVLEVDSPAEIAYEVERTDSDPEGVGIMTRKARVYPIRLERVPLKASPLLKQEALAVGADAAHARGVADHSVSESAVLLFATLGQYHRLIPKLARQPFRLGEISRAIEAALAGYTMRHARSIPGLHRSFTVGEQPLVMGVVNVTPDSFSDGGRYLDPERAVARAVELEAEGADLLDIGGESTRPGAQPVDAETEFGRIGPVLSALRGRVRAAVSVDTRKPEVARRALEAGADLVNDVGGLRDPEMRSLLRESGAPAVVLHMRGEPSTMQEDTRYADLRGEVFHALAAACDAAIGDGVRPDRLLVDPGLGFGKTAEQNLELLAHLGEFRSLGFPVVVGASRKSFLGAVTRDAPVGDRLEAGLAAAALAAWQGAAIVRTHDVRATVRALGVVTALRRARRGSPRAAREAAEPEE